VTASSGSRNVKPSTGATASQDWIANSPAVQDATAPASRIRPPTSSEGDCSVRRHPPRGTAGGSPHHPATSDRKTHTPAQRQRPSQDRSRQRRTPIRAQRLSPGIQVRRTARRPWIRPCHHRSPARTTHRADADRRTASPRRASTAARIAASATRRDSAGLYRTPTHPRTHEVPVPPHNVRHGPERVYFELRAGNWVQPNGRVPGAVPDCQG